MVAKKAHVACKLRFSGWLTTKGEYGQTFTNKKFGLITGSSESGRNGFFFKVRDKESGRKHEVVVRPGFLLYS